MLDFRALLRLFYFVDNFKKYKQDGLLNGFKRGAKLFGIFLYDNARTLAFLYCGLYGAYDITKGDYEIDILKVGLAIGIPLSRYS